MSARAVPPGDRRSPHRRRWRWVAVFALVVVVLAAAVALVVHSSGGGASRHAAGSPSATASGGAVPMAQGGPAGASAGNSAAGSATTTPASTTSLATGTPGVSLIGASGSRLIIPSLGVNAPLVPTGAVGAPRTASLTIPNDIHEVAWWDGVVKDGSRTVQELAPKPGEPGVAVIAGHIDSAAAGPGALYDLKYAKVGDAIQIRDSNGQTSNWTVSQPPETSLKTELPPELWVTTGAPRLALVTCGGPFNSSTGHYVDNVIVWASPA